MTAVPKRKPGIRTAERSIKGTMVARSTARQTTVGPVPAAPRPALPAARPPAVPAVTSSSRVAIPTRRPDPLPEDEPLPVPRPRAEPRQPPSLRSQGRAPQRSIEPPVVRQIGPRARRTETFDDPPPQAPSKMAELRSTIAKLQQRLDELEPNAARLADLRERADLVAELLDEALDLVARPEGVMNRRRLRLKIEEARKVLV